MTIVLIQKTKTKKVDLMGTTKVSCKELKIKGYSMCKNAFNALT